MEQAGLQLLCEDQWDWAATVLPFECQTRQ